MYTFKDKNNNTVLLLHIPKNAGTTCGHFLKGYGKWHNLQDAFYNDHFPLVYARNIVDYDYSIAFVRNPYQRVLSRYFYLTQHQYYKETYKNISIDNYITNKICYANKDCWLPESWRKQVEYIEIDNQLAVDNLYKIEEVNVLEVMKDITGKNINVEPQNTSQHLYDLNDEQKQQVYNIYKEDFTKLGYKQ